MRLLADTRVRIDIGQISTDLSWYESLDKLYSVIILTDNNISTRGGRVRSTGAH